MRIKVCLDKRFSALETEKGLRYAFRTLRIKLSCRSRYVKVTGETSIFFSLQTAVYRFQRINLSEIYVLL